MGPIQTVEDLVDMVRRRAGMIAAVTLLGAIVSVILALQHPKSYQSTEVIQIVRPSVSSELAPTTVEGSSARRLQLIEQKLMARDSILEVIEQFGIFDDMPALTELEQVDLFRENVTIEGVAAAREGLADDGTVSALTITASLGSPVLAQAVVSELGARTIALSTEARREKSRAALEFFAAEEQALLEAISALEAELSTFRSGNELAISGGIETRREQIGAIEQALLTLEQGRISVQQQIDQIAARIQRPATQRLLEELNRQMDAFDEQQVFLTTRRNQVRQLLNQAPEVERQVHILQQRLDQYRDQLSEISAHRVDAEIGQRLEANRQAERMEVLEPASYPDHAAEPSRKKLAALGTMAAAMAALGLALVLEIRNPVIRTAAQMERELGFVPAIAIAYQKPRRVRRPSLAFRAVVGIWRALQWAARPIARSVRRAESWAALALGKIGNRRRTS